jgi:predicted permease
MKGKDFTELSDQELLDKRKKLKSVFILNAVIIGVFIGIAAYSAIKNGFAFFTFFPLIFAFILVKNRTDHKELEQEIKSRNLK